MVTNFSSKIRNSLLCRISNTLLRADGIDVVLDNATREVLFILKATTLSIALLSGDKLEIKSYIRSDKKKSSNNISSFSIGEGVAGMAALKKKIICVDDIDSCPFFIGEKKKVNPAKSLISIPMIFREELIGVLNVSVGPERKFTTEDKIFLKILSTMIASSIVNSRLLEKEKELAKLKDILISTATHELRTPLTATRGYLSMVLNGDTGVLNNEQTKYLRKSYDSAERLTLLVEDLLSTLRIDENKIVIEKSKFNILKIAKEAIENLSSKAIAKNISLSISKFSNIRIEADMIKTKQVIENIVDNAIKYSPNNSKVEIEIKKRKDDLILSVSDNGVGIKTNNPSSIFDRFQRINNKLSVKAGGTGLGLYIAKNYIEKQNGKIWFESEPNKGTRFFFSLPLNNN